MQEATAVLPQERLMQVLPNESDPARLDEILALFAQHQRRLYLYIVSMLPDPAAAEEVLQETNIVVWRKFDQFQPASDFRAWVFRIAYFEVRKYLERQRRHGVSFSPELLDELTAEHERQESAQEARREALPGCMDKLPAADRELIQRVYGQGIEVPALAEQTGRHSTSIYRSLRRIRQLLLDCVERTLAAEGTG
jgi:RNA polymerase sigma-70 factor (ECF subfamily)